MRADRNLSPALKILVEAGPLVSFFIANAMAGIYWGTGIFMAATAVSIAISFGLTGRIAIVPLIGAGFVAVFGALTLWLHDDVFIKVKVTLINGVFGCVLAGGMLFNRPLLQHVLGESLQMDPDGWRKLTWRWAGFFFGIALLNEVVWRHFDTASWVNFKVFALMPLTMLFAIAQLPLMQRHAIDDPKKQS
jgi:intracellular septation protein